MDSQSKPPSQHSGNEQDLLMPYQKLYIYHTKFAFLIVGYCRVRKRYALLEIQRQDGQSLQTRERVSSCSLGEINSILRQAHVDTQNVGGLQFVTKAYGIIGCIRFTSGFYLLIVTRKAHMGSIRGHKVYRVDGVALLPLGAAAGVSQQQDTPEERRYRKLLMGVDLTKGFYFSFTYHLAATLQCNYQAGLAGAYAAAATNTAAGQGGRSSSTGQENSFASAAFSSADFDSMFVWNSFLTRALRGALKSNLWVVALVHGYWDQRQLSVFGRPLTLTLLARRSRHFAGTRFKKRGISDQGKVANEVETEQILDAGLDYRTGLPIISSLVQLRGSVPLYWSQQTSALSPKPEIILQNFDPMFEATALHFADLRARYGDPLIVLNLLKSHERRPREKLLRQELAYAIRLLNSKAPEHQRTVYIPWDFQQHSKAGAGLLTEMAAITRMSLDATGLFVHSPQKLHTSGFAASASLLGITDVEDRESSSAHRLPGTGSTPAHSTAALVAPASNRRVSRSATGLGMRRRSTAQSYAGDGLEDPGSSVTAQLAASEACTWPPFCSFQRGVLRTNCIDCLDRTNVAQFAFGLAGLGRQLFMLGLSDSEEIDSDSSMAFVLMEQYELMGNTLALQYGGSDAHSVFFQRQKGEWEASTRGKDFLTSVKRFYSNAYTDADKQDAINLFLGNYVPGLPGQPELWELESDVYLHSADPRTTNRLSPIQAAQDVAALPKPRALPLPPPATDPTIYLDLTRKEDVPAVPAVEVSAAAMAATTAVTVGADPSTVQQAAAGGVPCLGGSWNYGRSTLPALVHVSSDEDSDTTAASAPARHQSLFDPSSFFRPGADDDEARGRGSRPSHASSTGSGMRLPSVSTGGSSWGISSLLASLFKPSSGPPLGVPNFQDDAHTLVAFDTLLSQPCRRAAPVRIHGTRSGQGSNLMWQAVQQAFAFYWTRQAVEEAAGMGADPARLTAVHNNASGALSPTSRGPWGAASPTVGAADGDEPSVRGGTKNSGAPLPAGSAVEALMILGQKLESTEAAPQETGPTASANARTLHQLSNPAPIPLSKLTAARQARLATSQHAATARSRPNLAPVTTTLHPIGTPLASSRADSLTALSEPYTAPSHSHAQSPASSANPTPSYSTSHTTTSTRAHLTSAPPHTHNPTHSTAAIHAASAAPTAQTAKLSPQKRGTYPPSPTTIPLTTHTIPAPSHTPPTTSPRPAYPAYQHSSVLRRRSSAGVGGIHGRLTASSSPHAHTLGQPSHPYLLPPPPYHHSTSSVRPVGVAPSDSVFTEGLWATWPAPCFSRGSRGSGAGSNSRRSQTDPWPAPAHAPPASTSLLHGLGLGGAAAVHAAHAVHAMHATHGVHAAHGTHAAHAMHTPAAARGSAGYAHNYAHVPSAASVPQRAHAHAPHHATHSSTAAQVLPLDQLTGPQQQRRSLEGGQPTTGAKSPADVLHHNQPHQNQQLLQPWSSGLRLSGIKTGSPQEHARKLQDRHRGSRGGGSGGSSAHGRWYGGAGLQGFVNGSDGSAAAGSEQPYLGGRCDSNRQLEGFNSERGEPCPAGLFSEGASLFLRDFRRGSSSREGSANERAHGRANEGSAASKLGVDEDDREEHERVFLGYGGLMPEARSWADLWYAMFAGSTTTQSLDPLFGKAPPLNGFRPYRGGCVGVAGSPLPPTHAAVRSSESRKQAQRAMLPPLPRIPARPKPQQRTATAITRFGTTQYGTIAPAPDTARDTSLLDEDVDGMSGSSTSDLARFSSGGQSTGGKDSEAAALALLHQLKGNTQKFRMIKRTPSGGFAGVEEVDARSLKHSHVSNMLEATQKLAPGRLMEALSGTSVRAKPGTDAVSQLNDFIEMGPSAQQHLSQAQAAAAHAQHPANGTATSIGPAPQHTATHANGTLDHSHTASEATATLPEDGTQLLSTNGTATTTANTAAPDTSAPPTDPLKGFSGGTHARQSPSLVERVLRPPGSAFMPKQPTPFVANAPLGLTSNPPHTAHLHPHLTHPHLAPIHTPYAAAVHAHSAHSMHGLHGVHGMHGVHSMHSTAATQHPHYHAHVHAAHGHHAPPTTATLAAAAAAATAASVPLPLELLPPSHTQSQLHSPALQNTHIPSQNAHALVGGFGSADPHVRGHTPESTQGTHGHGSVRATAISQTGGSGGVGQGSALAAAGGMKAQQYRHSHQPQQQQQHHHLLNAGHGETVEKEGEGEEDDRGLGFRLNKSLGGFIASGVSLAGLLLDELHDCGLQWDCCPWWIAKQEELHAGGMPEPKRASQYQAALLHTMVKEQGVRDDYLNFCECIGCLLTSAQHAKLREDYSFHALVLTMPLRRLAKILS